MLKGAQVEIAKMNKDLIETIGIYWEDGSSHAFVLEQVIQKLEKSGFAPRQEIMETWLDILQTHKEQDE